MFYFKKITFLNFILMMLMTFIASLTISFWVIYFNKPIIKLIGDKVINIEVNTKYEDPGYNATFQGKDIFKKIKTTDNINIKKLGKYEVIYKATINGNEYSKTRKVVVVDKIKPKITLSKGNEVDSCPNTTYKDDGYKAIDNYDGDITKKVKIVKEKDSWTYSVTDSSGNTAYIVRKIKYVDETKPVITLIGGDYMIYTHTSYVENGFAATDNCDGDLTSKVVVSGSVNTEQPGEYTLTYTVTDKALNKVAVDRHITVSEPPAYLSKVVYLTFDDGPSNLTASYLDILKSEGVKATFFINDKGRGYDYLIKRMQQEGHAIGNHTATHNYYTIYKSSTAFWSDIDSLNSVIYNVTGIKTNLIRFPGGSSNTISNFNPGIMTELTREATARGYIYVDWTIDSNDAGTAKTSADVYNNVISTLGYKYTNVVLMHDGKYTTLNALRQIIEYGKNHGFIFKVIDSTTPQVHHHLNN